MKRTKNAIKEVAKRIVHGVKTDKMANVNKSVTKLVREKFGSRYPADFFDSDVGKAIEPLVLCSLISILTSIFEEQIPKAELLHNYSNLAIEGSTDQLSELITSFGILDDIPDLLTSIAAIPGLNMLEKELGK